MELERFESALSAFSSQHYDGDSLLHQACRYALAGAGKRVRPQLVFMSAQACGADPGLAIPAALAVELVHTYSLVHDDLPSLDNDDLRRGRPTVHKRFDEATALLCGDSLLTDAFALLAGAELAPQISSKWVLELAGAAGGRGMVLGQTLDVFWTARAGITEADLYQIELLKTGKLLGAACALGGIAAEAAPAQLSALRIFGEKLGIAYQLIDDAIDDLEDTGKSQGKDRLQGKPSVLSVLGSEAAVKLARGYSDEGKAALQVFGAKAAPLLRIADQLLERKR